MTGAGAAFGLYQQGVAAPYALTVECPACRAPARFEVATAVPILDPADLDWFRASDTFELIWKDPPDRLPAALYRPGLARQAPAAIADLPPGFTAAQWGARPGAGLGGATGDEGAVVCPRCGLRRAHRLAWPGDAFFQIAYRGDVLWAWDRGSLMALIDWIASPDRQIGPGPWAGFLRHVPGHFLTAKARATVLQKLRRRAEEALKA